MLRASFIYHQITAILSLIASITAIYAIYRYKYNKLNSFQLSMIIAVVSISWGIHGVIHFLEEYMYDFEPISGSMKILTKPIRV